MSGLRARAAQIVQEFEGEATKRRAISPHDLTADVFAYCAKAVAEVLATSGEDEDEEISVAEYAALHRRSPSTVRGWCAEGLITATRKGRDWVIRRGEPCPSFGGERAGRSPDEAAA